MNCANLAKFVGIPLSCVILLGSSVAARGQTAPANREGQGRGHGDSGLEQGHG